MDIIKHEYSAENMLTFVEQYFNLAKDGKLTEIVFFHFTCFKK